MLPQELCNKGAATLQVRSMQVEEAANELINMLLVEMDPEEEEEDDEKENEDESKERSMAVTWLIVIA